MSIADLTKFQEALKTVKSALLVIPQNPTLDTVAAALSLALALEASEKPVTVSAPAPMTVEFNRLIGINKVREDLGDKNLVLSFGQYPAENIERVAYNIENGEFTLTVVPKPGFVAPVEDQIKVNYAGVNADMVVVVNANYPQDLGPYAENKELLERPTLAILSNVPLSGWTNAAELIDPSSSSVCEVVYDLILQAKLPFDQDIATNLLTGIQEGTKNFTGAGVNANTFAKASQLMQAGAQRAPQVPQQGAQYNTFASMVPGNLPKMPADARQSFRDTGNLG